MRNWLAKMAAASAVKELEMLKKEHEVILSANRQLREDARRSKEELADLQLKKKIEEEDIKHLTKIRIEQEELKYKQKEMDLKAEHTQALERVRVEFNQKMQARLQEEVTRMKEMYGEILGRIPNINVKLKGHV